MIPFFVSIEKKILNKFPFFPMSLVSDANIDVLMVDFLIMIQSYTYIPVLITKRLRKKIFFIGNKIENP